MYLLYWLPKFRNAHQTAQKTLSVGPKWLVGLTFYTFAPLCPTVDATVNSLKPVHTVLDESSVLLIEIRIDLISISHESPVTAIE